MVYVDTCKKLSDPRKTGRLLHVLKPFILDTWVPNAIGGLKTSEVNNYFELAKAFTEVHPVAIRMLDSYRLQHKLSLERLGTLRDKNVLLIPGISVDGSEWKANYVGHDIFSDRFILTTKILETINKVNEEHDLQDFLENLLIIPVSPFFFPGEIIKYEGKLALQYAFPYMHLEINSILSDTQKKPLKSTHRIKYLRQTKETKGMTEFSDLLFSYNSAVKAKQARYKKMTKEQMEFDMYELKYVTHINRQIMRRSLETILKNFNQPATFFAKKTSYARQIIDDDLINEFGIYDIDSPLEYAGMTNQGESDPSAQRKLGGWLRSYGPEWMSQTPR